MDINGIRNDGGSAINSVLTLGTSSPNPVSASANASSASPAASSSVSKPGELMAKLSQLLQQDPAKFKQVAQQISDDLKSQAAAGRGPQAQFLTKMSDDFAQAANSGSLASLQPPNAERGEQRASASGAHRHHGGHHASGAGQASGGLAAVLSKALDEVSQALSTSPSSSA